MNSPLKTLLPCIAMALAMLTACHPYEDYGDEADYTASFDCLADIIDTKYCYLDEKGLDWAAVRAEYRKKVIPGITQEEFFNVCADMLNELRDGHVNLASPFNISYYRRWWTDYPQDFNLRTLQQSYLDFDYGSSCGISYKILPSNIGYMYYSSFTSEVGAGNLDYILYYLGECNGLIIDIRNNGGGDLENIRTFVGRFIHTSVTGGYIRHKTGPGHQDFSEPYPITYHPTQEGHVGWDKPVVVLTNRSCFSAANDFVSVMKELPNVRIVGARTGGGGGLPFTYDLPIGWTVRLSTAPLTDAHGLSIEDGIEPSPGCEVHSPDDELAIGIDRILDFAINLLQQ